jgi:hypothetical protein
MEEKITQLMHYLRIRFWGVFLLSASFGIFFISFPLNEIIEESVCIKLKSAAILILLGFIPFALWLYNKKVVSATLPDNLGQRIDLIVNWFVARLLLVFFAFMSNIVVYAVTKDSSLLYCSGIALMFLFFLCKPNKTEITQLLSKN